MISTFPLVPMKLAIAPLLATSDQGAGRIKRDRCGTLTIADGPNVRS
jgi:hypothetical protein